MGKKPAFTLAEVLITLGIIGIVAAMTLPSLVGKYQKKDTVAKLKKVYSVLQQATISAKETYGEVDSWDFSDSYEFGQKYFKPYLKVIVDEKDKTHEWSDLTGHTTTSEAPTLILTDGTYIFIKLNTYSGYDARYHILVDLNGEQKPNKLGRDLFAFTYYQNALRTYNQYDNLSFLKRVNLILQGTSGQCNKNAQGGVFGVGSYCSTLIEYDGWEIKDDYPW